ncbi:MAG: monovalent cation/H(+) antiporter subunit G [bacterium]
MTICCVLSMVLGLFFFLGTSVGLLRFPDFYTRMHAAGKGDTLSTALLLLSVLFWTIKADQALPILLAIKLFLIILFIFIGSPTATHALIDAGYELHVPKKDKKNDPSL